MSYDDYDAGRYGGVFGGNDWNAFQQGMNDKARWEAATSHLNQQSSWSGGSGWNAFGSDGGSGSHGSWSHNASTYNNSGSYYDFGRPVPRTPPQPAQQPFSEAYHQQAAPPTPQRGADRELSIDLELMEAYHGGRRVVEIDGKRLGLHLPAGLEDGYRIRVNGHGDKGKHGGAAGDLFVAFRVKAHTRFTRTGKDLHVHIKLNERIVAFGGDVLVPTPGEPVKVSVEPGVHGRPQLRLKGRGFTVQGAPGEHGDLLVTFIAPD